MKKLKASRHLLKPNFGRPLWCGDQNRRMSFAGENHQLPASFWDRNIQKPYDGPERMCGKSARIQLVVPLSATFQAQTQSSGASRSAATPKVSSWRKQATPLALQGVLHVVKPLFRELLHVNARLKTSAFTSCLTWKPQRLWFSRLSAKLPYMSPCKKFHCHGSNQAGVVPVGLRLQTRVCLRKLRVEALAATQPR